MTQIFRHIMNNKKPFIGFFQWQLDGDNMNIIHKKIMTGILVFDLFAGLLLFWGYWNKQEEKEGGGTFAVQTAAENVVHRTESETGQDALESDDVKKIAITFDDGPHPYYTEQLLDGLKERGVVATFFVTGEHATLYPGIIKRMNEEGHLIGNHTYSHMQLSSTNKEEFKDELAATSEVIEEIIGEEVQYVRPPYGTWDKAFESELNMIPVLWTIDPLDWCSDNAACVTAKVLEQAGENDIILLHDYYDTTVTAALKIVDELLADGYTFVTVDELMFD